VRDRITGTRRQEILDAAAAVFAEAGYASATVREVGERAGILSGSLYHHFDSKETMLQEILQPFLDDLTETYEDIAASDRPPLEQLEALVRAAYQAVADRAVLVTVLANEIANVRYQERFAFVLSSEFRIRAAWLAVFERGRESGHLRSDLDPRHLYRTLMGSALSAVRWFHPSSQAEVDEVTGQLVSLLLEGVATRSRDAEATR